MRIIVILMTLLSMNFARADSMEKDTLVQRAQNLERAQKALVSIKTDINKSAYGPTSVVYKSGFIIDVGRGWVVTNIHAADYGGVVASYEITFFGGQKLEAKSIYRDPLYNIQVLSFDTSKLIVPLAELNTFSSDLHLDDRVILYGKKMGQDIIQQGTLSNLYQTSGTLVKQVMRVSLNTPGSSMGGPVLDKQGLLVGLVLHSDQTFAEVLWGGYIEDVLIHLRENKKPHRWFFKDTYIESVSLSDAVKYLKFSPKRLQDFIARYPEALSYGLMVTRIGEKSAFVLGDVILSVNGKPIGPSLFDFQHMINHHNQKTVSVRVVRFGGEQDLEVSLWNAWDYVIQEMILFGGALFYESDALLSVAYNLPLRSLMVSKTLPGSVFSGVFPMIPTRDPLSVTNLVSLDSQSVFSLKDLEKVIVQVKGKPYVPVAFKDCGCALLGPGLLGSNRLPTIGFVDFIASTTVPEKLRWSEEKHEWDSQTQLAQTQKTPVQK